MNYYLLLHNFINHSIIIQELPNNKIIEETSIKEILIDFKYFNSNFIIHD